MSSSLYEPRAIVVLHSIDKLEAFEFLNYLYGIKTGAMPIANALSTLQRTAPVREKLPELFDSVKE